MCENHCPFCGSENIDVLRNDYDFSAYAFCTQCCARGPEATDEDRAMKLFKQRKRGIMNNDFEVKIDKFCETVREFLKKENIKHSISKESGMVEITIVIEDKYYKFGYSHPEIIYCDNFNIIIDRLSCLVEKFKSWVGGQTEGPK